MTALRRIHSVAAIGLILVLAGAAFAAKLRIVTDAALPNVDEDGNINLMEEGSPATLTALINTKNGKTRLTFEGTVENLSNQKQKYKDQPDINEALQATLAEGVKRSLYKVAVNGSAVLKASGKIDTAMLP